MLYTAYEWQRRLTGPTVATSARVARALGNLPAPLASMRGPRRLRAACQVLSGARPTHVRPDWRIDSVTVDGQVTGVDITPGVTTPFATLLHFAKPDVGPQPKVLLVGPISGHFATLLRPTVRTLLDWHNARDIPAAEGRSGLDEYINHVLQATRHLGPDTHVMAVCQPAPLVLAAVSVLAAEGDSALPSTLTLIAGPIDTRVNPNRINAIADRAPLSFYERFLISRVPAHYAGAGRRVYPGVAQLTAFMSMNARRHVGAHVQL
jgi:poly(3-hydroxybutyrate) depolymerase